MRLPGSGPLPDGPQALPLVLATDEGGRGREQPLVFGGRHGLRLHGQEALVQLAGGRTWLDPQLAAQGRHAGVVRPERTGAVTAQGEHMHQRAIGVFGQGVVSHPGLRMPDRGGVFALRFQQVYQL